MRAFFSLVLLLSLAVSLDSKSLGEHGEKDGSAPEDTGEKLKTVKQGNWWNKFFLREETGSGQMIGKLHSDHDQGDGSLKYILSGQGIGDIFTIDHYTGELFTMQSVDREEKAFYSLTYTVVNRQTGQIVEPETEFTVVVVDINDNTPTFSQETYVATVPENSNMGTSVIKVTATDADEGLKARLVYNISSDQNYFSVDPTTGVIRTAVSAGDLDREKQENYQVVVVASDMAGQRGGLTGTTVVNISVTDVNDNPPHFSQSVFKFSVPESIEPGSSVGRLKATDPDIGKNAAMQFSIVDGDGRDRFEITTDEDTQEGVIVVRKPLDHEAKQVYTVRVQVQNTEVNPHHNSESSGDVAVVEISVEDVDEPPTFDQGHYLMEVKEDAAVGTTVGFVFATDPDGAQSPVKYSIDRSTDMDHRFVIDEASGILTVAQSLDREVSAWHNISVIATEADHPLDGGRAAVNIHVLDVNDNVPVVVVDSAPFVCEGFEAAGQLIQTVTAVDRDEPLNGHKFSFSMASDEAETSLFTVQDNGDNTAGILTRQANFDRLHQSVHLVPVVISDGEIPMQSSTGTVTVTVCSCNSEGHCSSEAASGYRTLSFADCVAIVLFVIALQIIIVVLVKILSWEEEEISKNHPDERREWIDLH